MWSPQSAIVLNLALENDYLALRQGFLQQVVKATEMKVVHRSTVGILYSYGTSDICCP